MPNISGPSEEPSDQKSVRRKLAVVGIITVAFVVLIIILFFQLFIQSNSSSVPSVEIKKASPSANQATPNASATPSAQKSETADWKTYSSQKLGVSLKYPTEWGFINENLDYDIPNVTLGEKTEADMRIFITKGGPNEGQYKEWDKKQINKFEPDSYGGSSVRLSDISAGGQNGIVVKTETADSLSNGYSTKFSLIVYVKNNNDYYRISYGVPFGSNAEKEYQSRKKTFDLILSTFKFTD